MIDDIILSSENVLMQLRSIDSPILRTYDIAVIWKSDRTNLERNEKPKHGN